MVAACWWCRRPLREDDDEARRVLIGFDTEWMCGRCWHKSDPQVPVDYTVERDDFNIEGQPEFNGAFGE